MFDASFSQTIGSCSFFLLVYALSAYVWLSGFALFAFLIPLIREMVKDIEDINGDCEMECRTMPIVWGIKTTKIIATTLLIATIALIAYMAFMVLPFPYNWQSFSTRYVVFGLMIPIVCAVILLWASKTPLEYRRTQLIIKFVMFMGMLYSFVIYQNLL